MKILDEISKAIPRRNNVNLQIQHNRDFIILHRATDTNS